MTAFAGLFHRDGRPADRWPGSGLATLRQRGLTRVVRSGPAMLAATDMEACLPPAPRPALIVAADARLDNRGEIEASLGLPPCPHLPDSSLIAALYDRHGPACTEHLLGDFAFLIWDETNRTLFGARDHFGVRPFYYHAGPKLFIAATTVGALLHSDISPAIDEIGMADFVAGACADAEGTLYRQIRRLPPGHCILISQAGMRIERYWQLPHPDPATHSDAPEQFRHLFEQAVACRMTDASVGALLSGGLDSSSIAMTACRLRGMAGRPPLPSLSMTFDRTPGWSDGAFLRAVLDSGDFAPQLLACDDHDPLHDIDAMLAEQDGPYLAYNLSLSRQLYHHARDMGLRSLLDGHGGDEVVSQGFGRLNELAIAHCWGSLWREAGGVARIYGHSTLQVASPYLDHIAAIRKIRARWRHFAGRSEGPPDGTAFTTRLVAPDLARRSEIATRQAVIAPSRSAYQTEQKRHHAILSGPHQPYAFELLDRAAAATGLSLRFPFYDRRLVEFCLSLPSSAKLAKGYPRAILRDAMAGILPETVRRRRDKFDFSAQFRKGLARHRPSLFHAVHADAERLAPFVDVDVARRAIALLDQPVGTDTSALFAAWRIGILSRWLTRASAISAPLPEPQFDLQRAGG